MKEGRELDALVATTVMGWEWQAHPDQPDQPIRYLRPTTVFRYGAIAQGDETQYTDQLPHYSTDIGAAWQVWKKVAMLPPQKVMLFWAALRCLVALRIDYDYRITDAMATLNMEPEDICKAMLEAHGEKMLPDWYYEIAS